MKQSRKHRTTDAMQTPRAGSADDQPTGILAGDGAHLGQGPPGESRNFIILVIYQALMRTGWIFKTESVIMPAVLESLAGAPWMLGCLPMLNRFGQSIPPLLIARRIKVLPLKSRAFIGTTTAMTLMFAGITAIWLTGLDNHPQAASWIYLLLYAMFFTAIGINQLAYNTLQGKLIRPTRRGRLLMIADVIGVTSAVGCAIVLLPRWLHEGSADFEWIFGFSTVLFAAASLMAWQIQELPDHHEEPRKPLRRLFEGAWRTLREDANFRRLAMVSALFTTALLLFPFYQSVARTKLGLGFPMLVWWVVAQNAGTGLFSILTGPIADRFGNRRALIIVTLLICAAPLLAAVLISQEDLGKNTFSLVFLLIGLTPVAQKTFNNYTLEIAPASEHPRYLSTQNLCMAAPLFLSPVAGYLVGLIGFLPVSIGITALLFTGFLLSFGLTEPRDRVPGTPVFTTGDDSAI
ncbi:Major Facilitator Superfamily protein [Anatilimnocola aggregata]|uniref:Major Facilitator Superfamily protein n=1 Tax=Anatilimnocola aggregata TaxID=2528021 RepID=A0A517Y7M7_9BACT|nr:MFS transporter [Anatilimnocola aggregata]QDU26195.1 Major Facilitator Superfamily protein [Anatilimnocola aggregata]